MKKAAFVLLLLILAGLIYLNRSDLKNLVGLSTDGNTSESSASKNKEGKNANGDASSNTENTESPESTEAKPTTIDEDISSLEKTTLPGVDAQLNDNLQDIQL